MSNPIPPELVEASTRVLQEGYVKGWQVNIIIGILSTISAGIGIFFAYYIKNSKNIGVVDDKVDVQKERVDAVVKSVEKVEKNVEKFEDKVIRILTDQGEKLDSIIPLIKGSHVKASRAIRDELRENATAAWMDGMEFMETFIIHNHERYKDNVAEYKEIFWKKLDERIFITNMRLLKDVDPVNASLDYLKSIKLTDEDKVKIEMGIIVMEKVWPRFKSKVNNFIDRICHGDRLPQDWSLDLENMITAAMHKWTETFNMKYE